MHLPIDEFSFKMLFDQKLSILRWANFCGIMCFSRELCNHKQLIVELNIETRNGDFLHSACDYSNDDDGDDVQQKDIVELTLILDRREWGS